MIDLTPNLFQLFASAGIIAGIYVNAKLFYMIIYEIKFGEGAEEDYLRYGKEYVKENYRRLK